MKSIAVVLATLLVVTAVAVAQQPKSQPSSDAFSQSTTEMQRVEGVTSPTRIVESHTQSGGALVETRTVEARSINGGYAPISVFERETAQVNANTVVVVQRSYRLDFDGHRTLVQVTEEKRTKVPDGETAERTVSNPDLNGRLQVAQRDIESTRTAAGVQETNITTLAPGANGFTPVFHKRQTTEQQASGATRSTTTLAVAGADGRFAPVQVTDVVQTESNGVQKTEERISRDNGNGMALIEQSVRTERETPSQSRSTVEVYRRESPGVAPDSHLRLVGRQDTVRTTLSNGSMETEQRELQVVPGSANDLRLTRKATETSRPSTAGQSQTTMKIEAWDGNQGLKPVWIIDSTGTRRSE